MKRIILILAFILWAFATVHAGKTVLNNTATILYCKGFHLPGYRISITRYYLQANIHAIKQKMQGLTDREEEMNVPAPESRTNVKPFNKMQPGQGNLWKKETPKELLPP